MLRKPTINQFDFVFIIDTTGSMGHLIQAAQKRMVEIVNRLSKESEIDIRFGIVEYRDHPPQDKMIYKAYPFSSDLKEVRRSISGLKANGGGDAPEAVFAGIVAAINQLGWRTHARRMALLVGDAPPHGVGQAGDGFPHGCPSGETIESVSAKAEEKQLVIYSLGLDRSCEPWFEQISRLSGGQYFRSENAEAAMKQFSEILNSEFGELDFDRQVLDVWVTSRETDIDFIAKHLRTTPSRIGSSLCRLRARGIISDPIAG